jgi:hypothetical protein
MSVFNIPSPTGGTFTVKGPEGMTFEQAQSIFKQQLDTGSLAGLKVGAVVSSATQAAGGLPGAAAMLSQAQGAISGLLPGGTNLGSITSILGPGGAAAAGQVSSALAGGAAAFNSLTTAASGATGAISKALSGAGGGLNLPSMPSIPGVSGALTGAAGQIGSFANQAVNTVSKALSGTVTNPINVADFAKQAPALGGIDGMKLPDVTSAMASASKLVGQGVDKISDALGVGKFGFDAKQLEKAGLVKPGTAAAFLAGGAGDLVSVLKSPTVWTGKDGAKSLDSLLGNTGLQDKVQQGLMKSGLDGLKQAGVPVDKLNPQALAGVATNAAKSVTDTVAWMKGGASVPSIPGAAGLAGAAAAAAGGLAGAADALPADVKASFDNVASAGAFAVSFAQGKVEPALLKETKPEPASDTANTETVDAASTRVVGNEKVPSVSASSGGTSDAKTKVRAFIDFVDSTYESTKALVPTIEEYEQAGSITQEQWNQLNGELQAIKATFTARSVPLQEAAISAIDSLPSSSKGTIPQAFQVAQRALTTYVSYAKDIVKRIKDLANKIAT